jgi:rod shape-determining protein MreD
METLHPKARRDPYGSKINRSHMPLLALGVPWLTIMLGSLTPWLPVIASAPVLPPFGFVMMLAWRLLRPGLLPLWAGLPLGLFDDFYSGQPLGSGILLFSVTLIVIELVEARFPWRNFWLDWLMAAAILTTYIVLAALLSGGIESSVQLSVIVPMLVVSVVLYPLVARFVALLDRLRLMRVRRLA